MSRRILPITCFLYLTIANLVWIARDNRPPFWDMAYHQTAALRIVRAISESGAGAIPRIPTLTGFYPPVYHSIVAAFYGVLGPSPRVGQLANIPAAFILIFATFGIARSLLPPLAAGAAAALITFFPIMVWLSHAALIDYWLSSLVALAIWLLLRTENFSNRRWSILFGLVCGLGMLTKASFAAFVGLPALWAARSNWKNAFISAGLAIGIAAFWYAPQWNTFMAFYDFNSASGLAEGDPPRWSLQSALFYVRAMEGYQLLLPLFALFCLGAIQLARNFDRRWAPVTWSILGGWIGLLLLENKDPRYTMPLLPAVAIVTAKLFERRTLWLAVLLPFLLIQHYVISFGVPWLPEEVVLARGPEARWTWNWNVVTQSYAGLWGKPITADWKVDEVIRKVTTANSAAPVRVGLAPDIPSFDAQAFEYEIALRKAPVVVSRISASDDTAAENHDYLLVSASDIGHTKGLDLVESFTLPGGAVISLLKTGNWGQRAISPR